MAWSYSAGEYGLTVSVYERPSGIIYIRYPAERGYARRSLGHRDRDRAMSYADRKAAALRDLSGRIEAGKVTLAELFALYDQEQLGHTLPRNARQDRRRLRMFLRLLGPGSDPHRISLGDWEWIMRGRASGAIGPTGEHVPEGERRPLRPTTVRHDMALLARVLRWGARWRTRSGRYLLREDPARGYPLPKTGGKTRRPIATRDRYEALLAVASGVRMRVRRGGTIEMEPSYLPELLILAVGTGRRIRAILRLRAEDLRLDPAPGAPHGAIRWPAETEKTRRETVVPISPAVRGALEDLRQRSGAIGRAWLLPAPYDPARPLGRHTATRWLREAERLAMLDRLPGGAWHPFRRMWATERKHLPGADVAKAGGWASEETLRRLYTLPDAETMLHVVLGHGELRERSG